MYVNIWISLRCWNSFGTKLVTLESITEREASTLLLWLPAELRLRTMVEPLIEPLPEGLHVWWFFLPDGKSWQTVDPLAAVSVVQKKRLLASPLRENKKVFKTQNTFPKLSDLFPSFRKPATFLNWTFSGCKSSLSLIGWLSLKVYFTTTF